MKLILLTLCLSICAFSQPSDSLREIEFNKRVQGNISSELSRLSHLNLDELVLEDYIVESRSKCLSIANSMKEDKSFYTKRCEDQAIDYTVIGDLETIIDMQIAELGELQSSWFRVTLFSGFASQGDRAQFYLFLPLTLALDIIFIPVYVFASIFGF